MYINRWLDMAWIQIQPFSSNKNIRFPVDVAFCPLECINTLIWKDFSNIWSTYDVLKNLINMNL